MSISLKLDDMGWSQNNLYNKGHPQMYPTITIVFRHFPWALGQMDFLLKCESKLKSKTSHSLIHMGFIRLVTWSGVRGLWKKGSERLKECLRVLFVVLFISTFLGWALLLLSYSLIFIALLCLPCKMEDSCLLFLSLTFGGFAFYSFLFLTSLLPNLELGKPHACVVCIALSNSLAVVPT